MYQTLSENRLNFDFDPSTITDLEKEKILQSFFNSDVLIDVSNKEYLKRISQLIDFSLDFKRLDGLNLAIINLEPFLERDLTDFESAEGHYFLANAYSNQRILKIAKEDVISKWENPELEKEILHLRLSLKYIQSVREKSSFKNKRSKEEKFWEDTRFSQINTNLGKSMNDIGRFAEGVEYRNTVLSINPRFGMALGCKGISYLWYAQFLHDRGHQFVFYYTAYRLLKMSLNIDLEYVESENFQKAIPYIQSKVKQAYLEKDLDLNSFSLGDSEEEIQYRKWCLQNCLFLNPLNDIGPYPIAARDILHIPSITTNINEGPNCQILYNLLKQEFVTARYSYYKGISGKEAHFSDKEVFLFDTEDNPIYSKASEEIKNSFRICYSIFDKIAFFLNYYFKLGLIENRVYFRKIWYIEQKKNKHNREVQVKKPLILNPNIINKNNLPLLGLFWISKDLFEDDIRYKEALEPDAKEWHIIRNHLEHKFLKLGLPEQECSLPSYNFLGDVDKNLTHSIEIHDFERKSLKLLKTVCAALIYLVLSMQYEEAERQNQKNKAVKLVQISLQKFPDESKINDYRVKGNKKNVVGKKKL